MRYYDYSTDGARASISKQNMSEAALGDTWPGSPLFGIRFCVAERIDTEMRKCETLSLRDKMETIGIDACHIIDANNTTASYTVWINPKKGFSISKAEIYLGPGAKRAFYDITENEKLYFILRDVKFKQINGIHVPIEYTTYWERWKDSVIWRKRTISGKVKDITFKPDHKKLGSFVPKMQEGTEIRDRDTLLHYTWKNSQIFPPIYEMQSLINKPISDLKDLKIDLSDVEIRDKSILVCFFDMQQRPSRRYVLELAKQSETLNQKGLNIFAVQATTIDENELNEWIRQNDVPFSVGMIKVEEKIQQAAWGVKSLPWLILTDKNKIVRAEGFALEELDEIIK